LWSLGITAIEIAEKKPPRFELNLMRAMFTIMESPPPTLTEPKEWSNDFNDFLEQCLRKEPSERPAALDLLMVRHAAGLVCCTVPTMLFALFALFV
jgi:serine/threonine protein kinase